MTQIPNQDLPKCSPFCTVPEIKDDVSEIKESIRSLHSKQDLIIELNAHMGSLRRDIDKLEATKIRDHDNMFKRIGILEMTVITKKDLALILTALSVIFTVITFGVNVLLKVLKVG